MTEINMLYPAPFGAGSQGVALSLALPQRARFIDDDERGLPGF